MPLKDSQRISTGNASSNDKYPAGDCDNVVSSQSQTLSLGNTVNKQEGHCHEKM